MSESTMHSRRNFLKGAGLATAAAAAFIIAGCSSGSDEPATKKVDSIEWDGEYDVIVVGAGAAGLAAAATVATEGDGATCLLLEKAADYGGNSPFCLGAMLFTENPDAFSTYMKGLAAGTTPDDVIDAYVAGLSENFEWLKALGAAEEDMYVADPAPAAAAEWPEFNIGESYRMVIFTGMGGGAPHIHMFLADTVKAHSDTITFMNSTPFEALVQDAATKEIVGVVAAGKNYRAAKGVIMCCGGFENDPDMLATYHGVRGVRPLAATQNTGDGHRACMHVGADQWHMTAGAQYWMGCRNLDDTEFMSRSWDFTSKQFGITVGMNGRRFYQDWDGCAVPNPNLGIPYAMPGDDITLAVGYRHGITQFGGAWTHLPFPERGWYIFDADGLAAGAVPQDLSTDPVADGWALSADTIEELAAKIEVPATELAHTVEIWNGFCDDGEDKAFYRSPDTLAKIAKAPFYAVKCAPTMLNTDGGPVRNAKGEILDVTGEPIAGLYSAGEFGSVWGNLYQGAGNIGECLAFGRISVRSALARSAE